jgi:anti-sigma B factor antagonist
LRVSTSLTDGWLQTIAVEGELDAYTAPTLQEAVMRSLDEGVAWLLVDLRLTEYIDSVGLGLLIGGAKRAGEKNGDLAVVCARAGVCRVFEVSGTAEMLNLCEELPVAVDKLATTRAARGGCEVRDAGGEQA